jgi:hypothetical protein
VRESDIDGKRVLRMRIGTKLDQAPGVPPK